MKDIMDLTDLRGFQTLYATLAQRHRQIYLNSFVYNCYRCNMDAVNKYYGVQYEPLSKAFFTHKMEKSYAKPYLTDIQTIKALTLLEQNMDDDDRYADLREDLHDLKEDYASRFREKTGYDYTDPVTCFSLCENTLHPIYEPKSELDPAMLLREQKKAQKFVYISAPLRGDVQRNIAFAKEKAREVFEEGHIPVCPHLMFPPIADPTNSGDDKRAMQMCLKLMERCDEVRVYGPEWTEGMHKEIRHADRMKIPMYTDQTEVPRSRPVQKKAKAQRNPER